MKQDCVHYVLLNTLPATIRRERVESCAGGAEWSSQRNQLYLFVVQVQSQLANLA